MTAIIVVGALCAISAIYGILLVAYDVSDFSELSKRILNA